MDKPLDAEALIEAYLAGDADAGMVARLEAWLSADLEHRRAFLRASQLRVQLRMEISAHEHRQAAHLSARRWSAKRPPRRVRQAHFRSWYGLAAAALVVLALGLGWMQLTRREAPAAYTTVVSEAVPEATVVRGGNNLPLVAGRALQDGDLVLGACSLRIDDGSELRLDAHARLALDSLPGSFRVTLSAGRIEAKVAPRSADHPFVVLSNHAQVTVVGTRFAVEVADDISRVDVYEGKVRVQGADGEERLCGVGDSILAAAEGLAQRVVLVAPAGTAAASLHGAYATLQAAVDAAHPGDLIRLMPGRHLGGSSVTQHTRVRSGGTAQAWLTIAGAADGGSVLVSRSWNALQCQEAAFLRIRDLVIEADPHMPEPVSGNGIDLLDSHHITISGCTIRGLGGDGIAVSGSDHVVIVGNRIDGCSRSSHVGQGGISISSSLARDAEPGPHMVIEGNRIRGCRDMYPNRADGSWSGGNGIGIFKHQADPRTGRLAYPYPIQVSNNIIWRNDGGGIWIFASDNIDLIGNILHRNGRGPGKAGEISLMRAVDIRSHHQLIAPQPGRPAVRAAKQAIVDAGSVVWGGIPGDLKTCGRCPWEPVADEDEREEFVEVR